MALSDHKRNRELFVEMALFFKQGCEDGIFEDEDITVLEPMFANLAALIGVEWNVSVDEKVKQRLKKAQEKKEYKDTDIVNYTNKYKVNYNWISTLDLENLEKDPVQAYRLVEKNRIWPPIDIEAAKNAGADPRAIYVIYKIRESFGTRPFDSRASRKAFVGCIEEIRDLLNGKSFEEIKALDEGICNDIAKKYVQTRSYSEQKRAFKEIYGVRFFNTVHRLYPLTREAELITKEGRYQRDLKEYQYKINFYIKAIGDFKVCNTKQEYIVTRPYHFQGSAKDLSRVISGGKNWVELRDRDIELLTERKNKLTEPSIDDYSELTGWEVFGKTKNSNNKSEDDDKAKEIKSYLDSLEKPEVLKHLVRKGGKPVPEISIKQLTEKYGFKNIVFGNSIPDKEAKVHVEYAIGAMMDLQDVTGINIKKFNQLADLALLIAARGCGRALACYLPQNKAINLSRKAGAGVFAHEWGHCLDNVLSERSMQRGKYTFLSQLGGLSYSDKEAAALLRAMATLIGEITRARGTVVNGREYRVTKDGIHHPNSRFYEASLACDRLQKRSQPYWASNPEMFARIFENYIYDKMAERGYYDNYLCRGYNIPADEDKLNYYPYPDNEEKKIFYPAMDTFLTVASSIIDQLSE